MGRVEPPRPRPRRPAALGGRHGLQNGACRHRSAHRARAARRVRLHHGHGRVLRGGAKLVRAPPWLAPRTRVARHDAGRGVRPGGCHQRIHAAGRPRDHPAARVLPLPPDDPGQRPQNGHEPAALRERPLHHGLRGLRAPAGKDGREAVHPVQPAQPRRPRLDRRRAATHRRHLPAPRRHRCRRRDSRRLRAPRLQACAVRLARRALRAPRRGVHGAQQNVQPGRIAAVQHLHPRPRPARGVQTRPQPHGLRRAERARHHCHSGVLRARGRMARRAQEGARRELRGAAGGRRPHAGREPGAAREHVPAVAGLQGPGPGRCRHQAPGGAGREAVA